jgi:hypothetical protein
MQPLKKFSAFGPKGLFASFNQLQKNFTTRFNFTKNMWCILDVRTDILEILYYSDIHVVSFLNDQCKNVIYLNMILEQCKCFEERHGNRAV